MAKKKTRKYVKRHTNTAAQKEAVNIAYGASSINPDFVADLTEYKKQSHEELYFPIAVRMVDTQEIKIIKGIYALPRGRGFVILTTNED